MALWSHFKLQSAALRSQQTSSEINFIAGEVDQLALHASPFVIEKLKIVLHITHITKFEQKYSNSL